MPLNFTCVFKSGVRRAHLLELRERFQLRINWHLFATKSLFTQKSWTEEPGETAATGSPGVGHNWKHMWQQQQHLFT